MNTKVVLDTNIFVAAAFNPESSSARIIEAVEQGDLRLVWNRATYRESRQIVDKIPPIAWERFDALFRSVEEYRGKTFPESFFSVADPDDRKFAALADFSGAVLVSNDDHLLSARDQLSLPVMSAGEYADKEL